MKAAIRHTIEGDPTWLPRLFSAEVQYYFHLRESHNHSEVQALEIVLEDLAHLLGYERTQ